MTAAPDAIEAFADALYDLLHERAQSVGILDISIEVHDQHVDGELMFSTDPDMGFTLDTAAHACDYCELLPDDRERWLDDARTAVDISRARDDEARRDAAIALLQGLLDARRPLLAHNRERD